MPEAPQPTTPPGEPPSRIQTQQPFVAFNPGNVPPTQAIYLQNNDFLFIRAFSNTSGVPNATLNYRYLTPQGEIKEGQQPFAVGLATTAQFPLGEGWLLTAEISTAGVLGQGQWIYVQLQLARGLPGSGSIPIQGTIWQGYVGNGENNGWPGGTNKQNTDGAGVIRTIVGTTPAAGADISESVPSFRRWQLLSARATLATSATVANRTIQVILDDGANIFYAGGSSAGQAATTTAVYTFAPGLPFFNDTSGHQSVPVQTLAALRSGYRLRTLTSNLQAGDQWTAPVYEVLEWFSWD